MKKARGGLMVAAESNTDPNVKVTKQGKFVLVSCTEFPVETLFAVWLTSRPKQYPKILKLVHDVYDSTLPTGKMIHKLLEVCRPNSQLSILKLNSFVNSPEFVTKDEIVNSGLTEELVLTTFKNVVAMSIPVSESVHFTWGFEHMPIAWREQAVRERQWGFWLTSMREFDMTSFVDEGNYFVPERFQDDADADGPSDARVFLDEFMNKIQDAYNTLLGLGMTQEEARNIIPLSAMHNGAMFSTLRTLLNTLNKRSCWISQVELWGPVIQDMSQALRKEHPVLGGMISPPCFKPYSNEFQGCKFKGIMDNRVLGKDPYAVCPLYMSNTNNSEFLTPEHRYNTYLQDLSAERPAYAKLAKRHLSIWEDVWNRNVYTGMKKE